MHSVSNTERKKPRKLQRNIMDDSADSDVEENLEILQPTILQHIKKILREYRNDVQIIKELIQNADDAGATQMKILYQGKCINTEIDDEKKFRKCLRAPALVFYNDAVFSEEDWKGVRSIYTSDKAQDPLKIGRFGLGFKSIFHMTDYPTLVSGDKIMFINPSEKDQKKVCTTIHLKKIKRSKNLRISDLLDVFEDTFDFHGNVLESGFYDATLFWFPLRQKVSQLSDTIYSESEVIRLLDSFIEESDRNILFAKTVSKIQVYVEKQEVKNPDEILSSHQGDLHASKQHLHKANFGKHIPVYVVEINNESGSLTTERLNMNKTLRTMKNTVPDSSAYWTFDVSVTSEKKLNSEETKMSKSRWLIVNYLKGGELSENMQKLLSDESLNYHHFVGIAAEVNENDDEKYNTDTGRVFCYQPLPRENQTGLPIYVNALFALGNNRRQIKWEDKDSSGMHTDKEIEWNHALVSEILPHGYHLLFREMISLSKKNDNMKFLVESVYRLVPDFHNTDEKWIDMGKTFLKLAAEEEMFHAGNKPGHWVASRETILIPEDEPFIDTIAQLLTEENLDFAVIPKNIEASLLHQTGTFNKISPELLGYHMLKHTTYKKMSGRQKEHLLQYIASGSSFNMFLDNLELLPRSDGTYTNFRGEEKIFFESEEVLKLFPGMLSKFVSTDLLLETSVIIQQIVNEGTHRSVTLDAESAEHMFNSVLKENFGRGNSLTLSFPDVSKWKHWLENVWTFIQSRYREQLHIFASLPIFPFGHKSDWENADEIKLCSLSSKVMRFPECEDQIEAEVVSQAFELLSVNVVKNIPSFITTALIDHYITDDKSAKLVHLLERIESDEIHRFNTNASRSHKCTFLRYVAQILHTELTQKGSDVLKEISIFKQVKSTFDDDFDLVSIKENCHVYQGKDFPVKFYRSVILISLDTQLSLAKKIGAEVLDDKKVTMITLQSLDDHMYTEAEKQTFILWVLSHPEMMKSQEILQMVKQIRIVQSEDGQWKKPSDLFDPADELISKIFKNEDVFPKLPGNDDAIVLQSLRHLGLKTREDIKQTDVKRTCDIIDRDWKKNKCCIDEKAEALLGFLNCNPNFIDGNFLSNKHIIPIKNVYPDNYPDVSALKVRSSSYRLCLPSEVKSSQYLHLIGSIYFTRDCTSIQNVAEKLGWTEPPEVSDIIRHFQNVVKSYRVTNKSSYIQMITKIYERLAGCRQQRDTVVTTLLQTFQGPNDQFIWNGDIFVSPCSIFIDSPDSYEELRPFISRLPAELNHLSEFFSDLGCEKHPNLFMFIKALDRIKQESEAERWKNSQNTSLRKMSITILNKLKDDYLDEVRKSHVCLHFPVFQNNSSDFMMKPVNECVYCEDGDFDSSLFALTEDAVPIHSDVPIQTARALGVPNIKRKMLSESDFFEGWGQEEPLAIRIRNIIKHSYEDGFAVFKELFQNADDAGADAFYIMYDERENNEARTSLISDRMSKCQGPAIWVYNNALFSEQDFRNIRMLGMGTKRDKAEKIGEFGEGFCAVYNITDVPSILSGSNFIIFDPHTTFLDTALPQGCPGVRIDLRKRGNADAIRAFPDQFKPYENVFGCKMFSDQCPFFNGTLFRLPLRSEGSQISDTVYTNNATEDLMKSIMDFSSNLFLFNQNTQAFKMYHLPKYISDPSQATLVFEVEVEKHDVPGKHKLTKVVSEVCKRKATRTLDSVPLKQLQEVNITTKDWSRNDENEISILKWLVSWATGTDQALLDISYKNPALLPLGSVAVPIASCTPSHLAKLKIGYTINYLKNLSPCFYKSGRYFCTLPTVHSQPFRFHINGKFHLSVDRKSLKINSDEIKNTHEIPWNEMLMSDAVVSAFLFFLESTAIHQMEAFKLWPSNEAGDSVLNKRFVATFYACITSRPSCRVFEHGGNNVNLSQCAFLDPDIREDEVIGNTAFTIVNKYSGLCAIDIPRDKYSLLKDFSESDKTLVMKIVTPENFLLQYFLPKLDYLSNKITRKDRNSILTYAVNQNTESVKSWLKKNKCIPSDDGCLKEPTQIVDPKSKLARLFFKSEGFFPEYEFVEKDQSISEKLKALGMRTDGNVLSDKMILNRVNSVTSKKTMCSGCAFDRSLYLVSYLCEQSDMHETVFLELNELPFLPVMTKPEDWPFIWHADYAVPASKQLPEMKGCKEHEKSAIHLALERPCCMYTCDFIELVGCNRLIVDKKFSDRLKIQERWPEQQLEDVFCKLGMHGKMQQHVNDVVSQLKHMSEFNGEIPASPTGMKHATEQICEKVYDYLEEFSDASQVDDLKDKPIIWVNNTFVSPQKVSHDVEIVGCQPYLYNLKESAISRCPNLCDSLQILEHLYARDVAGILHRIAVNNGNTPCDETQITACVNILHLLKQCLEREKINNKEYFISEEETVCNIYAPDENGTLRSCSTLCLNDSDEIERTASMIYVHERVPLSLAKTFNIKSKTLQRLEETAEEFSDLSEDFYQEEPLCSRLRRLVDGFSLDSGIFKEILQNADDAKANEVVFIKDFNTYPIDNVPDERFKHLQGPALCVYNDSAFSKEDLNGIKRLGMGNKSNDPSKAGKYGVGFNVVYNITDAPSFYSAGKELENGETLCFFDPLARFIPNVSKKKPGKRFKDVQWIRESHSDILQGYHEKRFPNLREKGTVFRFPLRTAPSEIKHDVINLAELSELLELFCDELKHSMVFLKHLKKVRVYAFDSGEYTEEYCIESKLSDTDLCKRSQFAAAQATMCKNFSDQRQEVFNTAQVSVEYTIILRETLFDRCISSAYHVVQTIGFDKHIEVPEVVKEDYEKGNIELLPQGGIAARKSKENVFNNGKAFCLLPLPVDTGLPVHVNGHFSLDHETRRSLWKSEDKERCCRTQWNLAVLNHVIAKSYTIFLKALHSVLFKSLSDENVQQSVMVSALGYFFSHFPVYESASEFYWKELTKNVYSRISEENLPFIPVLQENMEEIEQKSCTNSCRQSWFPISLNDADQCPCYHCCEIYTFTGHPSLHHILKSVGMKIARVPKNIRDSFEKCGLLIERLSPKHVIDHLCKVDKEYEEISLLHINQTNFQNESNLQKVFDYCLIETQYFFERLQDLPIILTQDGVLRRLDVSNIVFVTKFTEFFPERLGQFVHKCLANSLLAVSVLEKGDKGRKDFTQMSHGLLRRFTMNEFMTFAETDGLFGAQKQMYDTWNRIHPSKELIETFWTFFLTLLDDHSRETVDANLGAVKFLHLIPAHRPTSYFKVLLTTSDINSLIDLDSFTRGTKLYDVMKKFGFSELDKTAFKHVNEGKRCEILTEATNIGNFDSDPQDHTNTSTLTDLTNAEYEFLLKQVPNFDEPAKCIRCLVRNITQVKHTQLKIAEAGLLLKYFSDRANLLQNEDEISNLKKVPIFATQVGGIESIDGFGRIVVVPKDLPTSGLDMITEASNVILLKDLDVKDIYDMLDVTYLPMDKVYTELIFPNHHHLTRDQFFRHVDYLCRYVLQEKTTQNENILHEMKELWFIETRMNIFVRVKDTFYDLPHKPFFKHFCDDKEMLPNMFHKKYIIDVFKRLGLQCKMNIHLFERFASEIEAAKRVDDIDVRRKSQLLIDKLFRMGSQFYTENDFMNFSLIPFIIPDAVEKALSAIHQPYNSVRLFCFAGTVRYEKRRACWTTANILPYKADPVMQNAHQLINKLGICSEPDVNLVATHCANIGRKLNDILSSMTVCRDYVTKIMEDIYKALKELQFQDYRFGILKDVPIIYFPERNTIKLASSVVINCVTYEELEPYLVKSPAYYGQFENVFLQLGASREPSAYMYATVIQTIKQEIQGQEMSQIQRQSVLKAMFNLFRQLRKQTTQLPLVLDTLYFLSDENVLTDARALVVDNNRYLHKRLGRGIKLSYMAKDFPSNTLRIDEIIDSLKNLNENIRPLLLTEIVKEEVDMTLVSYIDSDLAENVETFIHNQMFVTGICRLARHGIRNKLQQQWSDEIEKDISAYILNIGLKHVQGIRTNLVLRNEIIENTSESKKVHIHATGNKTIVYFDITENTSWYSDVTNCIILHLKEVHGCLVDELLFTAQKIFMCRDPKLCEEILDRDGIEAYKSTHVVSEVSENDEQEEEREPNHWYSEAERWQKQANRDLDNARESLTALTGGAYNWVCYQAHQAAEKSLKAAWYAKDANKIELVRESHCLQSISQELSSELRTYAQRLSNVTEWHTRMRYPNAVSAPRIPSDCYNRTDAETVVKIAQEILHEVQTIISSRD